MPRPARPDDLYRLAVPFDPRALARRPASSRSRVKRTSVGRDGYRHAIWLAPTDGSSPARQVTIGGRTDRHPRFSPDGRTLAFISDRRLLVEEEPDRPKEAKDRLDCDQVFLLPLDGGEARRLTDLPRGVTSSRGRPTARSLAVLSSSLAGRHDRGGREEARPARRSRSPARRRCPTTATSTGSATSTTARASSTTATRTCGWSTPRPARRARSWPARRPRASPPGARTARGSRSRPTGSRDPDLDGRSSVFAVDVATRRGHDDRRRRRTPPSCGPPGPATARAILALGDRFPRVGYRTGIWRFAADGSDAGRRGGTDLLATSELKPDAAHEQRRDARRGAARRPGRRRRQRSCSRRRSTAASSCGGCRSTGRRARAPDDRTATTSRAGTPCRRGDRRPRGRRPLGGGDAARGRRVRGRRGRHAPRRRRER